VSADGRHEGTDVGVMTRRELVSALARWTVPTVLTLSLGARAVQASSCPACTKLVGGVCRACTVSQILNCQCEPCLGPPYCPGGTPTSAFRPAPNASLSGGLDGPAPAGQRAVETWLRQRAAQERSPFLPGFGGRSGFGARGDSIFGGTSRGPYGRPWSAPGRRPTGSSPGSRSLYDRLRSFDERR
jgi:hypothetical protein